MFSFLKVRNPLLDFPAGKPCFCGSQKKFKRCCATKISVRVSRKAARIVKTVWPDIMSGRLNLPTALASRKLRRVQ